MTAPTSILRSLALALAASALPCAAWAAGSLAGPKLDMQAQVVRALPNDTLRVTLTSTHEQGTPQELTRQVLADLQSVSSEVRDQPDIQEATGPVQVQPLWKDNHITGWSASASLVLTSRDIPLLAGKLGVLSEHVQVSSVRYSLSRQARQNAQAQMLAAVSKDFRAKAQALARDLGYESFTLAHVQLSESGDAPPVFEPRPMIAMAAMKQPAGLAPEASGTTNVSVTLAGSVTLSR